MMKPEPTMTASPLATASGEPLKVKPLHLGRAAAWFARCSRGTAVRRVIFYGLLLAVWDWASRSGPWPSYVLPEPAAVAEALYWGVRDGHYLPATLNSLIRLSQGYVIALTAGVLLGALIAAHKVIDDTVGSLMVGLQALPSICWLPLAILWFGLNEQAIIFVVVMGSLFSIVLSVDSGIRQVPALTINAAKNLGLSGARLYWFVVLPSALPSIAAGLKQGWAFAWRSLMAAELLYYTLSLGSLLQTGRDLNDVSSVVAVMLVIVAVGVAFSQGLFAPLERWIEARWGHGALRGARTW